MSTKTEGSELISLLPNYGAAPPVVVQKPAAPRPWLPEGKWQRAALAAWALVVTTGLVLGFSYRARAALLTYSTLGPADASCMVDFLLGLDQAEHLLEAGAEEGDVDKETATALFDALIADDFVAYFVDNSPQDSALVFTDDDGNQYQAGQQYKLAGAAGVAELVAIFGNLQASGVTVKSQSDEQLVAVDAATAQQASQLCDTITGREPQLFFAEMSFTLEVEREGGEAETWALDVVTYEDKSSDEGTCACKCFFLAINQPEEEEEGQGKAQQ